MLVGGEQLLDALPQACVAAADLVQISLPLGRARLLQRGGEHHFLIHRTISSNLERMSRAASATGERLRSVSIVSGEYSRELTRAER